MLVTILSKYLISLTRGLFINTVLSTHLSIAMNILTCLCCPVPDHVKTDIGYISLFAIMDAESDAPIVWRSVSQSDANYSVMTGSDL
jgi:hypothetical protein